MFAFSLMEFALANSTVTGDNLRHISFQNDSFEFYLWAVLLRIGAFEN